MNPASIPGGLLVAIEGIDGAGKTTLAASLRDWLVGRGARVDVSKEPTAGPWGMKLRESAAAGRLTPEQELDYLIRDRIDHVNSLILPALMSSTIVILDRYYPSMVAYQGAAGLSTDVLLEANAFAPRPDVLLILDLPPTEGLSRIRARGDAPNHFEDEANLVACRQIFLDLPMDKNILDATLPPDHVLATAQKYILLAITAKLRRLKGATPEVALAVEQYLPALSA